MGAGKDRGGVDDGPQVTGEVSHHGPAGREPRQHRDESDRPGGTKETRSEKSAEAGTCWAVWRKPARKPESICGRIQRGGGAQRELDGWLVLGGWQASVLKKATPEKKVAKRAARQEPGNCSGVGALAASQERHALRLRR